jgi:hypothetical protein
MRAREFGSAARVACVGAWLVLFACFAPSSFAQSRAYLDRDRIALDETVTLTIHADIGISGPPDVGQFLDEFRIVGHEIKSLQPFANGAMSVSMVMTLELQPKREGAIEIPPFAAGDEIVGPLRLMVTPARNVPAPPSPPRQAVEQGSPVVLQAEIDADSAYVQQSVGYVVRLYYDPMMFALDDFDQPSPQGATLQRVGQDIEADSVINGRQFKIFERRYLVLPNRPGTVQVPAPKFEGRGVMSLLQDIFSGRSSGGPIRFSGETKTLRVKQIPANAPQPWLPLRGLTMRYLSASRDPRVGEAAKVTVELVADGGSALQLPELAVTAKGAEIYPDPAQIDERFSGSRLRTRVVREFSVVPEKPGVLRVVAPRIAWWDVEAGVARTTSLPDLRWDVAPAQGGAASASAVSVAPTAQNDRTAPRGSALDRYGHPVFGLVPIAILALLWALALGWGGWMWSQRSRGRRGRRVRARDAPPPRTGYDAFAYKRLFENGSLAEISEALCAMAQPRLRDLDRLRSMLDDAAQRAALDALQRARWNDGDIAELRIQLRRAFADGPHWRSVGIDRTPPILPPLYPER